MKKEDINKLVNNETTPFNLILEKDKEIERLNNIINKVIEFCNFGIKEYITDDGFVEEVLQDVLDIIKGE